MSSLKLASKSLDNLGKKKKNSLIFLALALILLSFLYAMFNGIDIEGAIKARELQNKKIDAPDLNNSLKSKADTKISWAINMENKLDGLEKKQKKFLKKLSKETESNIIKANDIVLAKIENSNKVTLGKIDELSQEDKKINKKITSIRIEFESKLKKLKTAINTKETLVTSTQVQSHNDGVILPPPELKIGKNNDNKNGNNLFKELKILKQEKPKAVVNKVDFSVTSYSNKFVDKNETKIQKLTKEEIVEQNTFEVLTGFTEGYMLTGAYAPLFGGGNSGGESKPVPVLIESVGDFLMPNDNIGSLDKCFLLGVATGNAGARAIEIRLDKATCLIGDSGRVLQGEIEGYVVSESGTPGLPATLIYKAGDFISRMIGAGILEGLSSAVVNSAAGYNASTSSSQQFYGDTLSGAGDGMSNAFTKLSDFYLELAESTVPILEVKPGRFISLVLVGGNKFELKKVNLLDVRDVDGYINEFIGE